MNFLYLKMYRKLKFVSLFSFAVLLTNSCQNNKDVVTQEREIVDEIEYSLKNELLNAWYPITLDTVYGGFLSDFRYDWHPDGPQNKMIVTQARHVWTASQASMFLSDKNYVKIASHGFQFMKNKMWDNEYGGFFMLRNRKGDAPDKPNPDEKTAYGNAFAIYALSAYYKLTGDSSALNLAMKTFFWLEAHSHDPQYKGYFNQMMRDGSLVPSDTKGLRKAERISVGWKDQNSSIHLMEAFTSLYEVWPDSLLRTRLQELLTIIRDTIVTEKGYLTLFLQKDWTPVSYRDSSKWLRKKRYYFDHVSFGHDVETAYLMLEASHVLGIQNDTCTYRIAKKMVDHALNNGWDNHTGGFWYEGYYLSNSKAIKIIDDVKNWWVEAEGLNALLLMSKLYPDEVEYYKAFEKQWIYLKKYLIDHKYGDWYEEGLDNSPRKKRAPKASVWKINYHNSRALMNCISMLKGESELDIQNN